MNTRPDIDVDRDGDGDGDPKRVAGSGVLEGRRRLLRASLGAAPVVLSMASGPVIAGQVRTASSAASAPLSGTTRGTYPCTGRSPQSWCTKVNNQYFDWPCATTTTYHGSATYQVWGSQCGTKKHRDVMNSYCGLNGMTKDTSQLNKLAAHCAASVLNVNKGLIDARVLDKAMIQNIWDSCNSTGGWSPTAGVTWTIDGVCSWMATTWS